MSRSMRIVLLAVAVPALAGCRVLGSLAEEPTLRTLAIFVAVAALLGFLVARMRR